MHHSQNPLRPSFKSGRIRFSLFPLKLPRINLTFPLFLLELPLFQLNLPFFPLKIPLSATFLIMNIFQHLEFDWFIETDHSPAEKMAHLALLLSLSLVSADSPEMQDLYN